MLTSLVILNSKVYGRAEIRLDNCDSLQLVGPNNIGKSTLIYALNFLFIIDGNKMTFSGQRKGDKETIHHYFPTPNQSFIVFEIEKQHRYCIMVKRDVDGNLEYYKFDTRYDESLFFTERVLHRFDEVKDKLLERGVELYQFKDRREVFQFVYKQDRKSDAVVWIEDNVKSEGISNNFSKVYRYLINTKLITNKNLKEALIVADNRENEVLNFSQKNKKDIQDLVKINNEIRAIRAVKPDFEEFREMLNVFNAKSRIINQLNFAFKKSYAETLPALQAQLVEKSNEINALKIEINEKLMPENEKLNQQIGEKNSDIKNLGAQVAEKEEELNKINAFEPLNILNQQLENYDQERKLMESRITRVEVEKLSSREIEYKLERLERSILTQQNQVDNYNNLMIQQISGDKETQRVLNSVLSDQVLALPASQLMKQVKKISQNLKIFDGEIDISQNVVLRELESVDEIKELLEQNRKEEKHLRSLLEVVKDIEKSQAELFAIKLKIDEINQKINLINSKPQLEEVVNKLKFELQGLQLEKMKLVDNQVKLARRIQEENLKLNALVDDKKERDERIHKITLYKQEVESLLLGEEEHESAEHVDALYHKIMSINYDLHDMRVNKQSRFEKLKDRLNSNFANEEDFIKFVEEEMACLEDKERSIDKLLQSISTQFATPAYKLLKYYEDFREFINNKFNKKLSESRISDIESLEIGLEDNRKLVDEVKKISQIQDFKGQLLLEFDQSENLKILNHYLDNARNIEFEQLFDITLYITRKGERKNVDLNEQIESDGTDKMIRLIIIMNIINRMAVNSDDNRIALFIDEVATIDKQNRPELVRFCREHHFIPIFAAPDSVSGFGKYYFIFPSKGKINISEKHSLSSVESKEMLSN